MNKPSVRQIKTLQLISQGLSKRQAMIKSGYSVSSANQAKHIFDKKTMQSLIQSYNGLFEKQGITPEFIAAKFVEWFNSPDEKIQLQAYDRYEKIVGINHENNNPPGIKRTISIEEFVFGQDVSDGSDSGIN